MSRLRRLLIAVAALAAVALLLIAVAHTGAVRARVLAVAAERVREQFGVDLVADRLDYNLFALSVRLTHLRLKAGADVPPFFEADELHVDLPWSVVTGAMGIQTLDVARPRVTVVRDADGVLNLPVIPESESEGTPLERLQIGALSLSNGELSYRDEAGDLSVIARGLAIAFDAAAESPGRLAIEDGLRIRVGELETATTRFAARLGFDGENLSVDDLDIVAPEASLRASARLARVFAEPSLEIRYDLDVRVGAVAPWMALDPAPSGSLTLAGRVSGPLADPRVAVELTSHGLSWPGLGEVSVRGSAAASAGAADVESFDIALAGGALAVKGRVAFGEEERSRVRAEWRGLDLATLLAAARVDLPMRLAANLDGEAQAAWETPRLEAMRLAATVTATRGRPAGRALSIAGRSTIALEDGAWRLAHDGSAGAVTIGVRADGRLDAGELAASPISGRLRVDTSSLGRAVADLNASGLPLDALDDLGLDGTLAVDLTLAGTVGVPKLDGAVQARDLTLGESAGLALTPSPVAAPGSLDALLRLDDGRFALEGIDLRVGGNRVTGHVTAQLDTEALDGRVTADLPAFADLLGDLGARWKIGGALGAEVDLGGSFAEPRVDVALSGRDLSGAGQQVAALVGRARLSGSTLDVESIELSQAAGGRLALSARYALDSGRYAVKAEVAALALRPVPGATPEDAPLPLAMLVDARFEGTGTGLALDGNGRVSMSQATWGDLDLGPLGAQFSAEGGQLRFDAGAPTWHTTMAGKLALDGARVFELTADVADVPLARVLPVEEGRFPIEGALALGLTASGTLDDLPGTIAEVALRRLDVAIGRGELFLERPATLRFADQSLTANNVVLRAGSTRVALDGRIASDLADGRLTTSLTGDLADLAPFVTYFIDMESLVLAGSVRANAELTGTIEAPVVRADLAIDDGTLGVPDVPEARGLALRVTMGEGHVTLASLRAEWQGATLAASGDLPLALLDRWLPAALTSSEEGGPARLTARIDPITQAAFEPWLDAATLAEIEVSVAATLTLEADALDLERVEGELTFERLALALARVPLQQVRPTRITIGDGRLVVADFAWAGELNQLDVSGGAEIGGDQVLDLTVRGVSDLRLLSAFLPDVATAGRATLDIQVQGPLASPVIDGRVDLAGGELRVREPRLAVTDLSGTIRLAGDRLSLENLTATANGGRLTLGGELRHQGLALSGGTITAVGSGMAFEAVPGLRTELDTDIRVALSPDGQTIGGRVTIRRGGYREARTLTAQLLEALSGGGTVVAAAEPSELDRVRLDLAVVTTDDIVVDNNYGRMEVGADLRLGGSLASPGLGGRLTVREGGRLFLGGQSYQIERGSIVFVDPTTIRPDLDLAARTRVGKYDITLSASGTPDELTTTLTSEEPLPQSDIVSLLLTGRQASESGTLMSAQTGTQMLGLLSGDILGFAGRAVGLDAVRLERGAIDELFGADPGLVAAEADPGARLSVTKRLSSQVDLVLSQNLRESGGLTWIAMYRPTQTIELRGVSRDDSSRAAQISQQLRFGGPARAAREPGVRAAPPRVEDVRIVGLEADEERDVREQLRLAAGERFDFYRWQQDRDAIERLFHERDYVEARVSARRETPGGEAAVTLVYDIDRGPRTRLTVQGFDLGGDVRRDLRQIWAGAVFDGFLTDDVAARVRRALAASDRLQAEVVTEIRQETAAGEARKELLVTITPGSRTPDRRLEFIGAARITPDRLEVEVQRRGLALAVWLRPQDLEAGLVDFYRQEGLLAATVSVGGPRFEGETATVPVTVVEGTVFTVADLRLDGVSARSEAEVQHEFGLAAGAEYLPARADEGRRQVERAYRRQGFNDVRTRVDVLVDAEAGQVALTLAVNEAAQGVLADVAVEGVNQTRSSVVERALRARLGEPVVLDDWFQARKRLYETGVFRSADVEFEAIGEAVEREGLTVQPTRARVSVEEWPPYRFRYGFQLADEIVPSGERRDVAAGVTGDLQHRNIFGRAVTAGLTGRVEQDLWIGRAFLSAPRFFALPFRSSVYLTRSHQAVQPSETFRYVQVRWTLTSEQEVRWRRVLRLTWGYRFDRNHIQDPDADPADPFALDLTVDTARLTSALTADTRDDPFTPQRGWFSALTLEYSAPGFGSDLEFFKWLGQGYYFRPVRGVVLASAVRFGGVVGPSSLLSELFRAGGGTTVRGYPEDSLGPLDIFGEPGGGEAVLLINQEARLPVWKWIGGVAFLDAGNVFTQPGDLSFGDLKVGVGAGLRIESPVGLFRVDYGVPMPRPDGSPFGRWYFSLGHIF